MIIPVKYFEECNEYFLCLNVAFVAIRCTMLFHVWVFVIYCKRLFIVLPGGRIIGGGG